jgi:hypothetical protein
VVPQGRTITTGQNKESHSALVHTSHPVSEVETLIALSASPNWSIFRVQNYADPEPVVMDKIVKYVPEKVGTICTCISSGTTS